MTRNGVIITLVLVWFVVSVILPIFLGKFIKAGKGPDGRDGHS